MRKSLDLLMLAGTPPIYEIFDAISFLHMLLPSFCKEVADKGL